MAIYEVDPIRDPRWLEFLGREPRASVFHTPGWLQALSRSYGYQPVVLTSSRPGQELDGGAVFCRVDSWLTGRRLVSLPFSDHCEPLLSSGDDAGTTGLFAKWLRREGERQRLRYIELRPRVSNDSADLSFDKGPSYYLHTLDLRPTLGQIFDGFHKDCIQRRIRHAERAGLSYETGDNDRLLDDFYALLTMTRRRHRLVPQPRSWFRNLLRCMGQKVRIRLARKEGVPIAAILTLAHRSSVVYKYGCSDARYHNLGAMPFLFWRLIEESKRVGTQEIDFGRTDLDNRGLIVFKDRLGTSKTLQTYLLFRPTGRTVGNYKWGFDLARQIVSVLPDVVLPWAGRIVYRHAG